jgi:hypothetical protein
VIEAGSMLGVIGPREQIEAWAGQHEVRVQNRLRNFAELFDASRPASPRR